MNGTNQRLRAVWLTSLAFVAVFLAAMPAASSGDDPIADPIPLLRVQVSPERLAAELDKAKRGVLLQMPRIEFEQKVKNAARAGLALKEPPRLIETRYRRVRLSDGALVGSAEWKVLNPRSEAGLVAVQPFGLALRQARWSDGKPALLGQLDGKDLELLVEPPTERSLFLEWSARGTPTALGQRFSLDVPACAVATLELELPRDLKVVLARDSGILSGPEPTDGDLLLWRVAFAGRSLVSFEIRRDRGADLPAPLLLSRLHSVQEIRPGQVEIDFTFTLDVLHGGIRELICECPAGMKPYEVAVNHLAGWDFGPLPLRALFGAAAKPDAPTPLVIRLREPFEGGRLLVRCFAPLPSDRPWASPGLRLFGAVPRGETLELRIDPDLQLEDWNPAGFRLLKSAFEANGKQVLNLTAMLDGGPGAERPGGRFAVGAVDFKTRQYTWWRIGPDRPTVTAVIQYDVLRGRLFRLPLQLPAGAEIESVSMKPAELMRHHSVGTDRAKPVLTVDLERALVSGQPAELTVRVRLAPLPKGLPAHFSLPFPDVVPLEGRRYAGGLGISVGPHYQGKASAGVAAALPETAEGADAKANLARPPWATALPDYYFPYHGNALEATLQLRQRPPRFRARCHGDVVLSSDRAVLLTRLELIPEVGLTDSVDLFTAGRFPGPWDWRTVGGNNPVQRVERLLAPEHAQALSLLGTVDPLQRAVLAALPTPRGNLWRLTFARPLAEPITLEASVELRGRGLLTDAASGTVVLGSSHPFDAAALALACRHVADQSDGERRWEVPLVAVPGADRQDGQVTLHLTGTDVLQVETQGLQEVRAADRTEGRRPLGIASASSWRKFQYQTPPVRLTLRGRAPAMDRSSEVVVDRAELVSHLEPSGRVLHHFGFHVWNWRQSSLPVRLPVPRQALLAVRADGRWLGELPAGESDTIDVPVSGDLAPHRFEIVYTSMPSDWRVAVRLDAPAPVLPVSPLVFRRAWSLAAGFVPCDTSRWRCLPGGASLVDMPAPPWRPSTEETVERQEQAVLEALGRLRKQVKAGEEWPLGSMLQTVLFEAAREPLPLVIDAQALSEAGVTRSSLLALPAEAPRRCDTGLSFADNLTIVPGHTALLLTTRDQLAAWQPVASVGRCVAASVETAAGEAWTFGHDRSGRFRRAADWLSDDATTTAAGGLFNTLDDDGTAWEPIADARDADTLLVLRADVVPIAGLCLAGILGLVFVFLRRGAFRFLLSWLALSGFAVLWLPASLRPLASWPALTALAAGLLYLVRQSKVRPAPAPRSTVLRPAGATLLGFVWFTAIAGQAAAPPPVTVYLVPDAANDPDKMTVLVPPELIDQLHALAKRGASGLRGAVLLSAVYEGRAERQSAAFEARFQVQCFGDEAASLLLPLSDVQLTEALLDGAVARPVAVQAPRVGYLLEVKGRGSHSVVLRFAAPLSGTGEERELRFGIPELPHSRLVLHVPGSAGLLHAVEARGRQHVADDNGLRLEADLGAVNALRARWRLDGHQPRPAGVSVEEAYYWELQPSSARLLALLKYRVRKGWTSSFRLDLPPDLEVVAAEAISLPNEPAAPRLRWLVKEEGGTRRLELQFLGPVTGAVQVCLELVPRNALGRTVALSLPTPLDAQAGPAFLAYRADGLHAAVAHHHAVTSIAPERVAKTFADSFAQPWGTARTDDLTQLPDGAFQRDRGGELHLTLLPLGAKLTCDQDVSWNVGPRQCQIRASAAVKTTDMGLSFLEWEIPPGLNGIEVTGPNLRSWARSGNRLQLWLLKPAGEATIQLNAWLPRAAGASRFDLPCLRMQGRSHPTTLRLSAGDGLALQPATMNNLVPRPPKETTADLLYATKGPDGYGGRFNTTAAAAGSDYYLLTFAEVRDRQLWFAAILDCPPTQGGRRGLTLALRNWEGNAALQAAPEVARQSRQTLASGALVWSVESHAHVNRRHQLTLTGTMPLGPSADVFMPEVVVEVPGSGATRLQRWLAVAGGELLTDPGVGVEAEQHGVDGLIRWPGEADRVRRARGGVWQVKADDWRLRLRPQVVTPRSAPVEVFLTEHAAALADGQRWLHHVTYWLYHEAGADLGVSLPPGATIRGLTVDGAVVPPLQAGAERLWLPLPGGAGGRVVRLTWAFADGQEPLDAPRADGPKLDGIADGPTIWTVHVPVGYEPNPRGTVGAEPAGSAAIDYLRASAQLQLAQRLAARLSTGDAVGAQLVHVRQRFERCCRQAELQLGFPGASDRQAAAQRLHELRDQFDALAKAHSIGRPTAAAFTDGGPAALALTPFHRGLPSSWQSPTGAATPRFQLIPQAATRRGQAFASSSLLVVLLVGLWIVGHYFPGAWPEPVALLGFLGILLFAGGWGWPFAFLPMIALGYRALRLTRHVIARLWPRAPVADVSPLP